MFESEFDPARRVMLHRARDSVCLDDFVAAVRTWFSHPEFDRTLPVVWDVRGAFLDLSLMDMERVYSTVRAALTDKRAGGRTAWVVSSATVAAIVRVIYEQHDWGSTWETFDDFDTALAWATGKTVVPFARRR